MVRRLPVERLKTSPCGFLWPRKEKAASGAVGLRSSPSPRPSADRSTSSDDRIRHRRHQKPPQTVAQVLRLRRRAPPHQATVVVILIFTVFKVKDPVCPNERRHRQARFDQRHHHPRRARHDLNADVSVEKPQYASFRYQNTTTTLYYRGAVIRGGAWSPGRAKARRTMRMNVTVDVITDRVLNQPDLGSDINSGLITMSSYTVVGGRVKIFVVKKHVTVRMNCSMTVNITSRAIQQQKCKRKVKL
ncbi:hypothetical protein DH2020_023105 [Rehmannia glutinosa]|uniref:Late embryogenesis abundant protein LEA-2 subgroup domain-containing protein n=1 Tax=Rehmannia glutinosa TaxID=99300 RepID=A0ABR0W540_REHGL